MKSFLFFLLLFLPLHLFAGSILPQDDPIIGKINGVKVRLSEVEDKDINDLKVKLYRLTLAKFKAKALADLAKIDKKYNTSFSADISDQSARDFYNQNNLANRSPYPQLKPQIVQYLMVQQMKAQVDHLYQQAIDRHKIQVFLKEPKVLQVKLPIASAYLWGNKKAKVMLLEFSDFQCPFCGRVQPTMEQIKAQYKKKVLFGYRHFPLQFHKQAIGAALAVECAREQGQFDGYHRLLFTHQSALFKTDLLQYAKTVGIKNLPKFRHCLTGKKYQNRINHDIAQASSIGIRGTPSFLIGRFDPKTKILQGEVLSGALPKAALTQVLDKYLAQ